MKKFPLCTDPLIIFSTSFIMKQIRLVMQQNYDFQYKSSVCPPTTLHNLKDMGFWLACDSIKMDGVSL